MRFIVLLLLVFIIFNSMLLITRPFFPDASEIETKDVTSDRRADKYGSLDQGLITDIILTSGSLFGITILGAGVLSRVITNFPTGTFIGAGSVISVVMGLWAGYSNPFYSLANEYGLENWYNFFIIIFGIIAVLSVVEIFTPKGDIN